MFFCSIFDLLNVLGLSQKKIMHFFRIEKQIDQTEKSQLSQGKMFQLINSFNEDERADLYG